MSADEDDAAPKSMTSRIAQHDWASTALGPRAQWPSALEHALAHILGSGVCGSIYWGRELTFLFNDASARILGERHRTALGRPAAEVLYDVWPERLQSIVASVLTTGTPFLDQNVHIVFDRDGRREDTFWILGYSRIDDPEHGARGVLGTAIETTAAVLDERKFRDMADDLAVAISVESPATGTVWRNARWRSYLRLPPELENATDVAPYCFPPDEAATMRAAHDRATEAKTPYEFEFRAKAADAGDDGYRWFLFQNVPSFGADGELERWLGTATDIHERKLLEIEHDAALERAYRREREASLAFQKASLPPTMPQLEAFVFDAVYEAAGRRTLVGGNWYDAFALPDGRVAISVGDVVGTGLEAAVTMAAVRQTIRGAAQVLPDPVAALDAADRALRSEQPERLVTAFVGILDSAESALAYSSAGHPPPLVCLPDGTTFALEARGAPLGQRPQRAPSVAPLATRTIALEPGALLVLYSDSLRELALGADRDATRLHAMVASRRIARASRPAVAIRDAALAVAGSEGVRDDVAILTVGIVERGAPMARWRCDARDAVAARAIRAEIARMLGRVGAWEHETLDAELVFSELVGNVVRYGGGAAEIGLDMAGVSPVLHVLDRGPGYRYFARLPRDPFAESGRGLFIVSQLADELTVVPRPGGGSHARAALRVAFYRPLEGRPVTARTLEHA